jgi:predicted ATPase/class 3 adenylate cyclase
MKARGLATLLLTDLVDSTRLNQQLGDGPMAALWTAHDATAREAMRLHGGHELGRSDGFLIHFDSPAAALAFAADYHAALATLQPPLRARVGLHHGEVILRPNPPEAVAGGALQYEVDGLALPLAARVMTAARGGQTLATKAVIDALDADTMRWTLVPQGHWRFKGVAEPVTLIEICTGPSLLEPPGDSDKAWRVVAHGPHWLPRREIRHTLPAERDSFVGRAPELHQLALALTDGARLVSVFGAGGLGKTRLVTHFGWRWLGDWPGGIWFCDLASARDEAGIHQAVAAGLELRLDEADAGAQIARALAGRGDCLLICDNFEQVEAFAGATLGRWLDGAPASRFIATTRTLLNLPGEVVLALDPLPVDDGARLLAERAAAAAAGSAGQNTTEADATAELLRLLDGLPLAIELAAVRLRTLPPTQLLRGMRDRFGALGRGAGRPDRQATLKGVFDWSWALLQPAEQRALAGWSVFDGGFDLAAAGALLEADAAEVPDLLHALADRSWLRRSGALRWTMLVSAADYAVQRLREQGAEMQARDRHARYYAGLDESAAVAGRRAELPNLIAACRHAIASGEAASAAATLDLAWVALRSGGPLATAIDLAESVARRFAGNGSAAACADWVIGGARWQLGQAAAAEVQLRAGLERARQAAAPSLSVKLRCTLAEVLMSTGREAEADGLLAEAAADAARLGDPRLGIAARNGLAARCLERDQPEAALEHYRAALEAAMHCGDRRWEGGLRSNIGAVLFNLGRFDEAGTELTAALTLHLDNGDRRWECSARSNLGLLALECGRIESACDELRRSVQLAVEMGNAALEASARHNLAIGLVARGDHPAAMEEIGRAIDKADQTGDERLAAVLRTYRSQLPLA